MRLAPGSSLGPYAIESTLGAGGMGEVYRARDTRLDRSVAVKVLGDAVAHDPQFRERFEREARAISALSHPNICTLFDVGHDGDIPYLVMELLEGETLAARLTRGAVSPAQAFSIAIQIGGALTAAHRLGIIHRDLKPGNIMLTRMRTDSTGSPHAKLLDFGLARSSSRESGSATTQVALTTSGETVGTIPYMSPEQLEGRPVDARSDIWSFGCVLYEMFAGHRAFAGDSDARLISEILTSEPTPVAPASLDRVIRKCLAKDPERRWQTSADLTDELQWISRQETTGGGAPATSIAATKRPRRWRDVILVAVGLILAALAFGAGYALRPPPPQVPVTSFDLQPPPGARWGETLALSPDGRRLAFIAFTGRAARGRIWIRDLDSPDHLRELSGTDGAIIDLFWSPDGTSIGFFADGKLKTIRAAGGPAIPLAEANAPAGGTWNRDDVIVYSPDAFTTTGLWRVPASGGKPVRMTANEEQLRAPVFLPDGRHLLYVSLKDGVLATSLHDPSQRTQVLSEATNVEFVAPGYLLFVRGKSLMAQRFDPDTLTKSGDPVMLVGAVEQLAFRRSMYVFSATDSGVLSYRSAAAPAVRQFVWVDRKGRELSRLALTGDLRNPVLSPDDTRVAFPMEQSGNLGIHVLDVAGGVPRRLTFGQGQDDSPVWSRNGLRLAFRRTAVSPRGIFEVSADGSKSTETLLLAPDANITNPSPRSYTRDGRTLVVLAYRPKALGPDGAIYLLPLMGAGSPSKWLDTPANAPSLSPDENWMAYLVLESSSRPEAYVQRYPGLGAKRQISENGVEGPVPQWRSDGLELFYSGPGRVLMAVPMKDGAPTGPAEALFYLSPFDLYSGFAVTRDGERFIVNRPADGSDEKTITVVTNWLTLMKK